MSIGEDLSEARHEAGLTVADVSARTRIREGLIRAIERDDFYACGGHFYARGHIRAIAAAVGADAARLVGEYDAAYPAGKPATLEELPKRPPRPPRGEEEDEGRSRRRRPWLAPAAFVLCLAAVCFAAFQLTAAPGGSPPSAATSAQRAAAGTSSAFPRPQPSRRLATASSRAGPRPAPTGAKASEVAPASGRADPRPAPTGAKVTEVAPASGRAGPRPAPARAKVTEVTPVSAAAYGPRGKSDGDNPRVASRALAGHPAKPWRTDWYTTARFGNLQTGTGLLLDLGRTVAAASVRIRLGDIPGASLQVRAGPALSHMPVVASATDAGGTVRLPLASHPRTRYLLIWFTVLPRDPTGTYQADISAVTVSEA